MNTPSPLIPQGALPGTRGKSHIRIAVITILAVHVVLLLALLMAGCKKTSDQARNDFGSDPSLQPQPFDPNSLPVSTNPPAPPTNGGSVATPPPVANMTPTPVTPVPQPFSPIAAEGSEHVVMKGDSFYTIAKHYNVSTKAIAAANPGVDSTKLKIGQKLRIPAASATAATPAGHTHDTPVPGSEKFYTVKSGDNLTKIARVNEVSLKALRSANNLKTDRVTVGQRLRIPAKTTVPAGEAVTSASAAGGTGPNP